MCYVYVFLNGLSHTDIMCQLLFINISYTSTVAVDNSIIYQWDIAIFIVYFCAVFYTDTLLLY